MSRTKQPSISRRSSGLAERIAEMRKQIEFMRERVNADGSLLGIGLRLVELDIEITKLEFRL